MAPGMEDLDFNSEEFRAASIPAANGMFTARSLARLYACLAQGGELDGVRLLSYDTVRRAGELQNRGAGRVIPISMRWRLGYHRVFAVRARVPGGFGHFGFGGSGGWADPQRQLSVALTVNSGVGTPFGDTRHRADRRGPPCAARTAARADRGPRAPFPAPPASGRARGDPSTAWRWYDAGTTGGSSHGSTSSKRPSGPPGSGSGRPALGPRRPQRGVLSPDRLGAVGGARGVLHGRLVGLRAPRPRLRADLPGRPADAEGHLGEALLLPEVEALQLPAQVASLPGRRAPLRHRERPLPHHARQAHGVLLRLLRPRRHHARAGRGRQARAHLREARSAAGRPRTRHRLRLGLLREVRRREAPGGGGGDHRLEGGRSRWPRSSARGCPSSSACRTTATPPASSTTSCRSG